MVSGKVASRDIESKQSIKKVVMALDPKNSQILKEDQAEVLLLSSKLVLLNPACHLHLPQRCRR